MPPRAAYCRNASEPSRPSTRCTRAGGRQVPHQNGALDDIMKPVPAGNTGQLAALPVEHRPCAGRGDLDVPRRKIPMVNGRMDASPAQCPADNRKQAVPGAGPSSRAQSGVSDTATVRFGSTQDSSNDGRAASCSRSRRIARKEIQRQRAQPRRLESRAQPGNRLRAGRDRRQEGFFLLDQTSRLARSDRPSPRRPAFVGRRRPAAATAGPR